MLDPPHLSFLQMTPRAVGSSPAASSSSASSGLVQDEFCHLNYATRGKIDFLELFTGSQRLSAAMTKKGLRVGRPIDLHKDLRREVATGVHFPWQQAQQDVMTTLVDQAPEIVWISIRCSPWTQVPNTAEIKKQRKPPQRKKLGRRKTENVGREIDARLGDLGEDLVLEKKI